MFNDETQYWHRDLSFNNLSGPAPTILAKDYRYGRLKGQKFNKPDILQWIGSFVCMNSFVVILVLPGTLCYVLRHPHMVALTCPNLLQVTYIKPCSIHSSIWIELFYEWFCSIYFAESNFPKKASVHHLVIAISVSLSCLFISMVMVGFCWLQWSRWHHPYQSYGNSLLS